MDSKLLAIIATIAIATTGFMTQDSNGKISQFEAFKAKYGKSYSDHEEAYRLAVYTSNMQEVEEHNDKKLGWTKGENKFSDLTDIEWHSKYSSGFIRSSQRDTGATYKSTEFVGAVNWVTKGDVQKVKDQGDCGSCWAFSAVAAVESCDGVFKGHLGDFSEQQVVDCDKTDQGCGGGDPWTAEDYLVKSGICTESSYPYKGKNGKCKDSKCTKSSFTISGHSMVSDCTSLKSACDKQPISVCVTTKGWQNYSGGIFNSNCGTNNDHCVLLAGYNSKYWLIKNSWGTSWGEQGYMRLAPGDTCQVCEQASVPHAA